MANTNTPEQIAYDEQLAKINAITDAIAKMKAREAFDAKYPNGRPANAPAPASPKTPGAKTSTLKDMFGIGEALLNDPTYKDELNAIKDAFIAGNLGLAQDLYAKSKWGKLDTTTQQRYLNKIQNSDLYNKTFTAWANTLKPQLALRGLKVDDAKLKDYFDKGIDDATIFAELSKGITAKGALGTSETALEKLRSTAYNNGFNLDKDFGSQVDGWLQQIANGAPVSDFEKLIRAQAKLGLPEKVGALLDQGLDLSNVYAPYRNVMSQVLELTPSSISLTDPVLQQAYAGDKEMSVFDFKRALRKDPRWQYTDNARQDVSNSVLGVLRDFGFQG